MVQDGMVGGSLVWELRRRADLLQTGRDALER